MTTAALPREHAIPRWHYALQLTGVVALTGAVLSIMSASDAVTGGAGPKLFLLLRMGALVLRRVALSEH